MTNGADDSGQFVYGLRVVRLPDGDLKYETQSINKGVPIEIVIMQLRVLLKQLEKSYFAQFEKEAK